VWSALKRTTQGVHFAVGHLDAAAIDSGNDVSA